jgi:hypothetical protein
MIKSKSTIRSVPTHHRQNPTEITDDDCPPRNQSLYPLIYPSSLCRMLSEFLIRTQKVLGSNPRAADQIGFLFRFLESLSAQRIYEFCKSRSSFLLVCSIGYDEYDKG